MRPRTTLIAATLALVFIASCAPGVNEHVGSASGPGIVAGFWRGLWHGIIVPITFLVSLFGGNVGIYELHNSGHWYDFGFVIGVLVFHGRKAAARAARRRPRTAAVAVAFQDASDR
jgi:hypothetical protein